MILGGLTCLMLAGEPALDLVALSARAQAAAGDVTRLQQVLARARRGEPLSLVTIGGSITEGAAASRAEYRWANRLAAWLGETFPQSEIRFHNAGIGATGSDLGAHRCARDVLAHQPDLVVVEFSVNHPDSELAAETMAGLVRQILSQPQQPAVMLLHTMHRNGGNAQEQHGRVGDHYGLPRVSFRDAVWPEIDAGRLAWEQVEADLVHPNDLGHQLCARFLADALAAVLADLPPDGRLQPPGPLPAPLLSDTYERCRLLSADLAIVAENSGFAPDVASRLGPGWSAAEPGSRLVLEASGTAFMLVFHRIKGNMGRVAVRIDGADPVICEAWFEADWGGYSAVQPLASGLPPGRHRIEVELLGEHHPDSGGTRFEVHALLAAGAVGL